MRAMIPPVMAVILIAGSLAVAFKLQHDHDNRPASNLEIFRSLEKVARQLDENLVVNRVLGPKADHVRRQASVRMPWRTHPEYWDDQRQLRQARLNQDKFD